MKFIKKLDNLNFFFSIFLTVGIIFTFIGIAEFVSSHNEANNRVTTTATITDIIPYINNDNKRSYDVYVEYEVNKNKYNEKLGFYSSNYYIGKEIEIYYYKDNIRKIGTKAGDIMLALIFSLIGIPFALIGAIGLLYGPAKKKKERKLQKTGIRINANYTETYLNTTVRINGLHPYKIICKGINPITNQECIFKSKNIYKNPEEIIAIKRITTFPVYIDAKNNKKYFVDISSISNQQ